MNKIIIIITAFAATAIIAGCGGEKKQKTQTMQKKEIVKQEPAFNRDSVAEEPLFEIVTTMGSIKVKLYSKTPKHRDNFVKLASEKFYDGILFHRVIGDFMIQVGDPNTKTDSTGATWGQGGPGYTIPAEIVAGLTHKKGALAAARKGDVSNPQKASSGSQFYIVTSAENCTHLNGEYTIFGEVVEGIDVVDKIAEVPTNQRDVPLKPIKITAVNLLPTSKAD